MSQQDRITKQVMARMERHEKLKESGLLQAMNCGGFAAYCARTDIPLSGVAKEPEFNSLFDVNIAEVDEDVGEVDSCGAFQCIRQNRLTESGNLSTYLARQLCEATQAMSIGLRFDQAMVFVGRIWELVAKETRDRKAAHQRHHRLMTLYLKNFSKVEVQQILQAGCPIQRVHYILKQLEAQDAANKEAFANMDKVHRELRLTGGYRPRMEDMSIYAQSTLAVAGKDWSRCCNDWVLKELGLLEPNAHKDRPPVVLLDAGSSWGPFLDTPGINCVAFDIAPARPEVLTADLIELAVTDCRGDVKLIHEGRLVAVEPEAYDAVVLSLVLSFVPTARWRRAMLERVRKCLKPSGSLFVIEKASLGSGGREAAQRQICAFQKGMEECGYKTVKQEPISKLDGGKKPHAYAWHLQLGPAREMSQYEGGPPMRGDTTDYEVASDRPSYMKKLYVHTFCEACASIRYASSMSERQKNDLASCMAFMKAQEARVAAAAAADDAAAHAAAAAAAGIASAPAATTAAEATAAPVQAASDEAQSAAMATAAQAAEPQGSSASASSLRLRSADFICPPTPMRPPYLTGMEGR